MFGNFWHRRNKIFRCHLNAIERTTRIKTLSRHRVKMIEPENVNAKKKNIGNDTGTKSYSFTTPYYRFSPSVWRPNASPLPPAVRLLLPHLLFQPWLAFQMWSRSNSKFRKFYFKFPNFNVLFSNVQPSAAKYSYIF